MQDWLERFAKRIDRDPTKILRKIRAAPNMHWFNRRTK